MTKVWIFCAAMGALGWPAWGQKIEVERPERGKVIHVQTALDHLTVLEMGEPVSTVAVGSPSFKVEWRENKVFIEPTEQGVATNLFVWTPSGRFNYELDPTGTVPEMVFAIDQPVPDPQKITVSAEAADPSPADILIATKPIRLFGSSSEKNRVVVYVTDLLERDGQLLIRYSIHNGTENRYVPGVPQVVALKAPLYRKSLYTLRGSQLSSGEASRLTSAQEISIEVGKNEIRLSRIEPGQETAGIVAIRQAAVPAELAVIRLVFLEGSKGSVSATLVL